MKGFDEIKKARPRKTMRIYPQQERAVSGKRRETGATTMRIRHTGGDSFEDWKEKKGKGKGGVTSVTRPQNQWVLKCKAGERRDTTKTRKRRMVCVFRRESCQKLKGNSGEWRKGGEKKELGGTSYAN